MQPRVGFSGRATIREISRGRELGAYRRRPAWYLGGDKAKGQQIFDGVTAGQKAEGSDWFGLGRIYAEAGEWGKVGAGASYLGVRPEG